MDSSTRVAAKPMKKKNPQNASKASPFHKVSGVEKIKGNTSPSAKNRSGSNRNLGKQYSTDSTIKGKHDSEDVRMKRSDSMIESKFYKQGSNNVFARENGPKMKQNLSSFDKFDTTPHSAMMMQPMEESMIWLYDHATCAYLLHSIARIHSREPAVDPHINGNDGIPLCHPTAMPKPAIQPNQFIVPPNSQIHFISPKQLNAMSTADRSYYMNMANSGASVLGINMGSLRGNGPNRGFDRKHNFDGRGNMDVNMMNMIPNGMNMGNMPNMPNMGNMGNMGMSSMPNIPNNMGMMGYNMPQQGMHMQPNINIPQMNNHMSAPHLQESSSTIARYLDDTPVIDKQSGSTNNKHAPYVTPMTTPVPTIHQSAKQQLTDERNNTIADLDSLEYFKEGPLESRIISEYVTEETKLNISMPDSINLTLYKAGKLPDGPITDRIRVLAKLCDNGAVTPLMESSSIPLSLSSFPIANFGLTNPTGSNLCYRNVVIQVLLSLPVLVRYLLSSGSCPSPIEYPAHSSLFFLCLYGLGIKYKHTEKCINNIKAIACDLENITLPKNVAALNPDPFIKPIMDQWMKKRSRGDQEDAEEFFSFILDLLAQEVAWLVEAESSESVINMTLRSKSRQMQLTSAQPPANIPEAVFSMVVRTIAPSNKSADDQMRRVWRISLSNEMNGSQDLLKLLGKDLAKDIAKYETRSKFVELPLVLVIFVCRTVFDAAAKTTKKMANSIVPNKTLGIPSEFIVGLSVPDMTALDESEIVGNDIIIAAKKPMVRRQGVKYNLISVVNHEGQMSKSGHYFANSYRKDKIYKFEDEKVEEKAFDVCGTLFIYTKVTNELDRKVQLPI